VLQATTRAFTPSPRAPLRRVLPGVRLIDSAQATAKKVASALQAQGLLNPAGSGRTVHYVTGDRESYRVLAQRLGEEVEELRAVALSEL